MQKVHLQYDHGKSLFYIGKHKKITDIKYISDRLIMFQMSKQRIHISMAI